MSEKLGREDAPAKKTAHAKTENDQPQFEQRASREVEETSSAPSAPFVLPPLPYAKDALAPFMSAETLDFHHDKHHKAYVEKANELIAKSSDPDLQDAVIEHIVVRAARQPELTELFNNAAQAWNHTFFWQCLNPKGRREPGGALAEKIAADLGGVEGFTQQFEKAAKGQFGSGWAWLVLENGKLRVTKTGNADTPLVHGQIPLLTLDVWEHAYYIDYRNKRPDYIKAFIENLVNWDFAEKNLTEALGKGK